MSTTTKSQTQVGLETPLVEWGCVQIRERKPVRGIGWRRCVGRLVRPEPAVFLSRKFPVCSIVRPTNTSRAAMGALRCLTDMGLFLGQSAEFFAFMKNLAREADAAGHGI